MLVTLGLESALCIEGGEGGDMKIFVTKPAVFQRLLLFEVSERQILDAVDE